jgi:hypothetical protein
MKNINQKEFRGYNGTLITTDTGVIIKRGVKGFLLGGGMLRGDKTIPYNSIVAVQLKKAGMVAGYIQLTLKGGSEAKSGLFQSTTDENSINFQAWGNNNNLFIEAKEIIEKNILKANNIKQENNDLNELEKLAELKEKGIINKEEFNAKKKQILGL